MKSCYIISCIFLLFLVLGYITGGFVRHHLYGQVMEEQTARMMTLREEGISKPMGWEDYEYLGSPEAALVVKDPIYQEEIYSWYKTSNDYLAEYEIDVLFSLLSEVDDNRWSLWDAYKRHAIFVYLGETYLFSGSIPSLSPSQENDWAGSLAESIALWEAAGGNREGNWMKVYKHSTEYEIWLDHIFVEIADPNRIISEYITSSKEDQYLETAQHVELSFLETLLWEDMLEIERKMIKIAYQRYLTHTDEKDFVRANLDSLVLEFVSYDFHLAVSEGIKLPPFLRLFFSPLRGFIIDICVILAVSIILTLLVAKKLLPRLTPAKLLK